MHQIDKHCTELIDFRNFQTQSETCEAAYKDVETFSGFEKKSLQI